MKVLHIINNLSIGGAEKLLIESIPLYSKSQHAFDIVVLNGKKTPFLDQLKETKSIKIYSLGNNSVYNPLMIFKIIPFLKKYDIIHVHLFPSLYWVAFAKIISFSSTKLIYTEHSTSNRRRDSFLFSFIDKIVYQQYEFVVAITDEVLLNLTKHLNWTNNNNKFQVIQNGLNLEEIKNAKPYKKTLFFADKEVKILIQVARFSEPKDQKTVINAVALLPTNFKLIFVGDGPLKSEAETLVSELNLQESILFLGVRTDVLSLLKTADFVILSSKYEGLSLSCIEGMASGKPFIASNVPGLKEVVEGRGLLFETGDFKALSNQIKMLTDNKKFYDEIANSCLQKAKQYDITTMITQYINLYESIRKT
jgi:glycosyltransferase involved in cell wall biosynthesis